MLIKMYRKNALNGFEIARILQDANLDDLTVRTELCYYVEIEKKPTDREMQILSFFMSLRLGDGLLRRRSFLSQQKQKIEFGPRLHFETSQSAKAVEGCIATGVKSVTRLEESRRFCFSRKLTQKEKTSFIAAAHDRMVEMEYKKPLNSFKSGSRRAKLQRIPLIEEGMAGLERFSQAYGLGIEEDNKEFLLDIFANKYKRNPTDSELASIVNFISDHSRHGQFNGVISEKGRLKPSMFELIKRGWKKNPGNTLIAFADDASAITGSEELSLISENPDRPSRMILAKRHINPTMKVESHNHPTFIEPYEGAATCIGGCLRDGMVVGKGGIVLAGSAVFYTDHWQIPGYIQSWETNCLANPPGTAGSLEIALRGSRAFYDYGNAFGLPTINGSLKTFGIHLPEGYKACMKPTFLGGVFGEILTLHRDKPKQLEPGLVIIQIGGKGYRIGVGGASASSLDHGTNKTELDFKSVQRGNAWMGQLTYRAIRASLEMGLQNPIFIAGDLGANGHANSLLELLSSSGGIININRIPLGDRSLADWEIMINESQERINIIVHPDQLKVITSILDRENTPYEILGQTSDDEIVRIFDQARKTWPLELRPKDFTEDRPPKRYELERIPLMRPALDLPKDLTIRGALEKVLRFPAVASKNFLVHGVDRSVGGRIAQQQCVGPNYLPLADYGMVTAGFYSKGGQATSLGDRISIGEVSTPAMARMSVAEAVLNMIGAGIQSKNIKFSANWMWPVRLPGERARMYDCVESLDKCVRDLILAIIGGKDSLSMSAKSMLLKKIVTVAAPGQAVITALATVDDITKRLTPEFKRSGSSIILIDFAHGKRRLGGSALAQVHEQIGNDCPDIDNSKRFGREVRAVLDLFNLGIVDSVHDVSDGGLITTVLEMCFGGNVGATIRFNKYDGLLEELFSEEAMLVVETTRPSALIDHAIVHGYRAKVIGYTTQAPNFLIEVGSHEIVDCFPMTKLRQDWSETSYRMDLLQANPDCVEAERIVTSELIQDPPAKLTFMPLKTHRMVMKAKDKPKVAIMRTPGTNGDTEMKALFMSAGFEAWDVNLDDLLNKKISLKIFRGVDWAGGFSYQDVFGSGKIAAGIIRYGGLQKEFSQFRKRDDTFSVGSCNGCQIMAHLGWGPGHGLSDLEKPRFIQNRSGRFESRDTWVRIEDGPSIMLKGMAGTILWVPSEHGEGYCDIPSQKLLHRILDNGMAPIRYVDMDGNPTMTYPFNPNGSPHGIAGLCSADGRHLSMMPHPERAFLPYQWPWIPNGWKHLEVMPWLKMAQNAYDWCTK